MVNILIYKITNTINNKVYIGLTTCTLEYRWSRHITESKNQNNKKHLYKSMRKYGVENFTIEEIDNTNDFKELGILERHYISFYDSQDPNKGYNLTAGGESNQYDGNPSAKLTVAEVVQIREIYAMKELRCKECWELFSDKISYSGFQKIWDGTTWKGIMDDVYTKENISLHTRQKSNPGSSNGNALYTESEVLEIRKYYVRHTLQETYDMYGSRSSSKVSFRQIIDKTYANIPIYSKVKKQWFLKGKVVNIDNYNPVSTISVSGE
jgi:group I intron endonuclease